MVIDISPIMQALVGLAATTIFTAGPVFIGMALTHMKNKAAAQAIQNAVTRAGAEAIAAVPAITSSIGPVDVRTNNAAISAGLAYLNQTVPDSLKRLGVTVDQQITMIGAEANKQQIAAPIAPPPASKP